MVVNAQPLALITGGAGFVGSHLCDRLLSAGHRVVCLDNLLTGRRDNVAHLLGNPAFDFVSHDVTRPLSVTEFPGAAQGLKPDYILHFAGPASPKAYTRYPIHTLKVGALGTYHALGLAKAHQATFLLASSSEVYGDAQVNPQPENYFGHVNPIGPRSMYDEAKRYAEAMASAYAEEHKIDVRIARIFNTYGSRMDIDDGRAVPAFMTQAIRGMPLTVYGDGSQTRSFCHIKDTVEGLFKLLTFQLASTTDGARPLVVNIGNPEEVTVLQVAKEIIRVTDSKSAVEFGPSPPDDPRTRRPDISLARNLLGWKPKIGRLEGLEMVEPYFRDVLAENLV